jgi:hypothetical protein
MKTFYTILISAAILILGSCKGVTTYTKYVQNDSDVDLTVVVSGENIASYNSSFTVPKGEKVSIYLNDEDGANTTSPNCLDGVDKISITYASDTATHTITKDPNIEANWNYEQNKKGKKVHNYCTFRVTDLDL